MIIFWTILVNNVIPLIIMIALGIVLQRAFSLDIRTLSKLNFYLFSPAIMFQLLYQQPITFELVGVVLLFCFVFLVLQFGAVEAVLRIRGHKSGMKAAMRNSVLFYNSANYGIPLNNLAFSANSYTLMVQVLVMMVQALLPNTYGIYTVNAHRSNFKQIFWVIASMPVIYAIPLAFTLRGFEIPLPSYIQTPIDYLASAFIGTALITLGVQLGSMKLSITKGRLLDVLLSCLLRLIAGPLLAWLAIQMLQAAGFSIDPLVAAALIVSSAVPTSLSSVLLAVEFDNESEFASQTVFISTLLSIFTVTAVIFFLRL